MTAEPNGTRINCHLAQALLSSAALGLIRSPRRPARQPEGFFIIIPERPLITRAGDFRMSIFGNKKGNTGRGLSEMDLVWPVNVSASLKPSVDAAPELSINNLGSFPKSPVHTIGLGLRRCGRPSPPPADWQWWLGWATAAVLHDAWAFAVV
ncbi:hypothetical protein PG985_006662 [Apiospora marii]|uniref:uncharacterized protein n=1 Tax=Apiospora marii TaxID=335849 RepID=UPI003131BDC1